MSSGEKGKIPHHQHPSPLLHWFKMHREGQLGHYIGDACWKELTEYISIHECRQEGCDSCLLHSLLRTCQERHDTDSDLFYTALADTQETLICRYYIDGSLEYVNKKYCLYFGKTEQELIRHNHHPLMPRRDEKVFIRRMRELTEKHSQVKTLGRIILPSGQIRWMTWIIQKIYNKTGDGIGYQLMGMPAISAKSLFEPASGSECASG